MLLSNLYINIKNILQKKFSPNEAKVLSERVFLLKKGYSKTDLILKSDENFSQSEVDEFIKIANRILENEPLEYIFNNAQFLDLQLFVDKNTLIPRPETEELVLKIENHIKQNSLYESKIFDIGTGSGCIPIYLKNKFKNLQVYACDVSSAALNVAKKNADFYNLDINFFQLDILDYQKFNLPTENFDIIVSNPPYVLQSEKSLMKSNVLDFEPYTALFVDDKDPLIFYDKICDFAIKYLSRGGKLYFEINEKFGLQTVELLQKYGFTDIKIHQDFFGKDRMSEAVKA